MKYVFQKLSCQSNLITICAVDHMNNNEIKAFFLHKKISSIKVDALEDGELVVIKSYF